MMIPTNTLHIETPTLHHAALSARLGKKIYLKMECYQPVGSFKMRGIGAMCQHAVNEGKTRLVSSSGGNAGYAAAYAGNQLGVPVTVVVPDTTSETAQDRMREQNAEVIVHGNVWNDADEHARAIVAENDEAAYVHPFDHPAIWDGHATMMHEASQAMPKPDAVVVAVGGGGLLVGVLQGLHAVGWADVPVLAVETEGAASFYEAHQAGEKRRLSQITSIAKTLGALEVTPELLTWFTRHAITPVLVSDADAVDACLRFADDARVLVEPACGAALSLMYRHTQALADYDSVLMIVCGGAGVTLAQLHAWQEALL
ncbi:MAG: pyridoxal-phosphate dependent enzyme [Chloroflexota bacterium]